DDHDVWNELVESAGEMVFIDAEDLQQLQAANLPLPYTGQDITQGKRIIHQAELCWMDAQVAVFLAEDAQKTESLRAQMEAEGWTVISETSADWTHQVIDALTQGNTP